MPLQRNKLRKHGIQFYGFQSSCGFAEVQGFSYGITCNLSLEERMELIFEMTDFVGAPSSQKKGNYAESYPGKHLIAVWNPEYNGTVPAYYERFHKDLKNAGWVIVRGGKGPHGGVMWYATITPEARDKFVKKYTKGEEKCKEASKSTEKTTPKSKNV